MFKRNYNYTPFNINLNAETLEDKFSDRTFVRQEGQYLILDNEIYPSRFIVEQKPKSSDKPFISFRIMKNINIIDFLYGDINSFEFNLWENSYDDFVLPGKIEKININTGMRNAEYYIDKKPNIKIIKLDAKTQGKWLNEYFAVDNRSSADILEALTYEFWYASSTIGIEFERTAISDVLCYLIWKLRWEKNHCKTYFKPIKYSPLPFSAKRRNWKYFNIRDLDYKTDLSKTRSGLRNDITSFIVYSKLQPDTIYFVNDEREAQSLLAELKFGNTIPLLPCGLSVFEDYYYMNIFAFKKMTITYDPEVKIVLSERNNTFEKFAFNAKCVNCNIF